MGKKNHVKDCFTKFLVKKVGISCNAKLMGLGFLLHLNHLNLQLPKNIGHEEMEI